MTAQWQNPRNIQERIVVTGTLTLETPTHFGNGDSDSLLDMPLHLDVLEGRALLTGTSIAGALRAYVERFSLRLSEQLFGRVDDANHASEESWVIVDDALGPMPDVELRDGVAIDPRSGTARDDFKFEIELLSAGTTFPLSFELIVPKDKQTAQLIRGFCLALDGLANGEIRLGKRKRRGFGKCSVNSWHVQRFEMTSPRSMVEWLDHTPAADATPPPSDDDVEQHSLFALLNVEPIPMLKPMCVIDADFRLSGSLLIRSTPATESHVDVVHLRSRRGKEESSVLSGTSAAGALRARSLRIANTLGIDGEAFVDSMFGYRPRQDGQDNEKLTASHLWVDETTITEPLNLVQTRVKIDRFTGGSYPGALMSEEPVFGAAATCIKVRMALDGPVSSNEGVSTEDTGQADAEIGMMLLLLKDLWTGDLPLGGGVSVGRGRLQGANATITIGEEQWAIAADSGGGLDLKGGNGDPKRLEAYVQVLAKMAEEGAQR